MSIDSFREFLQEKDKNLQQIYWEISPSIKAGNFADSDSLWKNHELITNVPRQGRTAHVSFPDKVNLLTSSIL